ncbi:MAG: PspA/IM30 family protein, partial [Polyangiaceae bacterium]
RKKRAEAQRAIQETMSGLKDQSAFETFDRMAAKVDQLEAEAEAGSELAEEYSGDSLTRKFKDLEGSHGADEDLVALKRKMGILPPEEPRAVAPPVQARVGSDGASAHNEEAELTAALEELDAEQAAGEKKKAER